MHVVVGGADLGFRPLRFHLSLSIYLSIFLSFFVSNPTRSPNGTQPKPATCSEGVCDLKIHVQNLGYSVPSPSQIGAQNHLFRRFRNLAAYIFGIKRDIDNPASALKTARGLVHRLEMSWTLAHKGLKIGPDFLPTLRKFCILLHCQA